MTVIIPTTFQFGEDLVVEAKSARIGATGQQEVVLDRPQPSGTLVRLGGRILRLTRHTVALRRARFGLHVAPVTEVSAPLGMHVVATSANLTAEPGDEIIGDITGVDLPERLRVVRVVRRDVVVTQGDSTVNAAIYEAIPATTPAHLEAAAA